MSLQVTAIMLGVKDVARSRTFYAEGLRRAINQDHPHCASLNLGEHSSSLARYAWDAATPHAGVSPEGSGFRGFSLHSIVESREEVDHPIARAVAAGGTEVKAAAGAMWGGSFGYFGDPDGYLMEGRGKLVQHEVVSSDLAEGEPAMKDTQRSTKRATGTASEVFTDEERAAMREYVQERKRSARRGSRASEADGESDVLAAIAALSEPDRTMAERLHALIKASAPDLAPRTWYGMPAYAKDGQVVCFFQSAQKFKSRYATLGFSDKAHLDEGTMWPVAYALKELTAADEARIRALLQQAVS